MIKDMYKQALERWESIKPLRGRVVDTRPAFRRERTKELIRFNYQNEDVEFVLYDTACLIIHKDNSFSLAHGGWITPSTSSFIHYCFAQMGWLRVMRWVSSADRDVYAGVADVSKDKNQLWLMQQTEDNLTGDYKSWKDVHVRYPIGKEPTKFVWNEAKNHYTPAVPIHIRVKTTRIDRVKSKQVLEKLKPFRKYLSTLVKLNDGAPLGRDTLTDYFVHEFSNGMFYSETELGKETRDNICAYMESSSPEDWLAVIASASVPPFYAANFSYIEISSIKQVQGRLDRLIRKLYGTEKQVIVDKYVGGNT